jgi:hypothetical protein
MLRPSFLLYVAAENEYGVLPGHIALIVITDQLLSFVRDMPAQRGHPSVWSAWICGENLFLDGINHLTLVFISTAHVFPAPLCEAFTGCDRRIERRFSRTLAGL